MVIVALLAGLLMFDVRPGNMPEPAPKAVRGKGLPEGWKVYRQATPTDVAAICRLYGPKAHEFNKSTAQACAIPALRAIVMPPEGSLPAHVDAAVLDHEHGHAWGYGHKPNSRFGWVEIEWPAEAVERGLVDILLAPRNHLKRAPRNSLMEDSR
mgnify:CR=1 FL=1